MVEICAVFGRNGEGGEFLVVIGLGFGELWEVLRDFFFFILVGDYRRWGCCFFFIYVREVRVVVGRKFCIFNYRIWVELVFVVDSFRDFM